MKTPSKVDPSCRFCAIEKDPGTVLVHAGPDFLVFLDHRPLFPGHCLLVPRTHVQTLADLPPTRARGFLAALQTLERCVESLPGAEGSFVAVNNKVSQSVPHLHLHVVPRRKGDGLKGFFWPRGRYESLESMEKMGERLRKAWEKIRAGRP